MQTTISYVCQCGHCGDEEINFQELNDVESNAVDSFIESITVCSCRLCGKSFDIKIYSYIDDLIIESDSPGITISYNSPYTVEPHYSASRELDFPTNMAPTEVAQESKDTSGYKFYGTIAAIFGGAYLSKDYIEPTKFIASGFLLCFCYLIYFLAKGNTIWQTIKNIITGTAWTVAAISCIVFFGSLFNCSGSNYSTPEPEPIDKYYRK